MIHTHFDLTFTASSPAALDKFQKIVSVYLSARAAMPDQLDQYLEAEPEMPIARCLKAYNLKLAAHPKFNDLIEENVAKAQQLYDIANERERQHIDALLAWSQGNTPDALNRFEDILSTYPPDTIALRMAHYLHFYNGIGADMAASTARCLEAYPEAHPHRSFVLGMHAFGLEEAGQLTEAKHLAAQGVEVQPNDLWSIHAYAHALYSERAHQEGIQWLERHNEALNGANNFRFHLVWHRALHELHLGNSQACLSIYDKELASSTGDDFYLDMCNNVSLLWRLEHAGIDVGERWQDLARVAEIHTDDRELLFASLHYLLALNCAEAPTTSEKTRAISAWAEQSDFGGNLCRAIGVPLSNLITARHVPEHFTATDIIPIGGSRAQRELFELMLAS